MALNSTSLIYEVSSEAHTHSSWLVATMHVQDSRAYVHYNRAVQLLDDVDFYCSEVDLDLMQQVIPPDAFLMPDGLTLSDVLGKHGYNRAKKMAAKAFDVDLGMYQRMMPIMLINQMTVNVLNKENPLSLDMALWFQAKEKAINLGGLESVDDQIRIMNSLDIGWQARMLKTILRDVSGFRKQTLKLVEDFASERLHRLYAKTKKDLGPLRHLLIYERNRHMVESFSSYHENGPTMAAVGAGHFSGEKGLIHLLKRQGFLVKPIQGCVSSESDNN